MHVAQKITTFRLISSIVLWCILHTLWPPLFIYPVVDHHHPLLQPWVPPTSYACYHLYHNTNLTVNLDATKIVLRCHLWPRQCHVTQLGPCTHDHLWPCTIARHVRAPTPPYATLPNTTRLATTPLIALFSGC